MSAELNVEPLVELVKQVEGKESVRRTVRARVAEFQAIQSQGNEKWFEELTYCLLTAYSSAHMGYKCVAALTTDEKLTSSTLDELQACLTEQGHRFAKTRAEYILEARAHAPHLKKTIQSQLSSRAARDWLVENVKGLGMKEASHYLRNVGYLDLAIIDRHIISNMVETGVIAERPKSLTRKRYLEYERILDSAAKRLGMPLGEMDLYLWYRKTGVVLK